MPPLPLRCPRPDRDRERLTCRDTQGDRDIRLLTATEERGNETFGEEPVAVHIWDATVFGIEITFPLVLKTFEEGMRRSRRVMRQMPGGMRQARRYLSQ